MFSELASSRETSVSKGHNQSKLCEHLQKCSSVPTFNATVIIGWTDGQPWPCSCLLVKWGNDKQRFHMEQNCFSWRASFLHKARTNFHGEQNCSTWNYLLFGQCPRRPRQISCMPLPSFCSADQPLGAEQLEEVILELPVPSHSFTGTSSTVGKMMIHVVGDTVVGTFLWIKTKYEDWDVHFIMYHVYKVHIFVYHMYQVHICATNVPGANCTRYKLHIFACLYKVHTCGRWRQQALVLNSHWPE